MAPCSTMLLACLALFGARGLAAQTQVTAQVTVRVPRLLQLQTVSTGGTTVDAGSFREVAGAVVLRVSANCDWRLVAVPGAQFPAELAGVKVRAEVTGGAEAAFEPLTRNAPVATGSRGEKIEVVVDYRLPAGASLPAVAYRLELAGA